MKKKQIVLVILIPCTEPFHLAIELNYSTICVEKKTIEEGKTRKKKRAKSYLCRISNDSKGNS